ncbi:hypothetical protein DMENIID0001_024150 [Sergentomyia squamirostris]
MVEEQMLYLLTQMGRIFGYIVDEARHMGFLLVYPAPPSDAGSVPHSGIHHPPENACEHTNIHPDSHACEGDALERPNGVEERVVWRRRGRHNDITWRRTRFTVRDLAAVDVDVVGKLLSSLCLL